MAISGVGSWLSTIDEFMAHWTDVDAELLATTATQLELSGGYVLTSLTADRGTLANLLAAVQSGDNARQIAASDRDLKRAGVRARMLQFRPAIRGLLHNSSYLGAIPRTPNFTDAPGKWRDRMDDMSNLWTTINANSPAVAGFTPPLTLSGGYSLANFNTERAALSTAFTTLITRDQTAQLARESRDDAFEPIYERLKQYRQVVLATFPAGHALIESLPRLTPLPGTTPAAVNLSGAWEASVSMARLTWSASAAPDLDHYEIRYHPGPTYKAAEEQFVDNVPAGTTTWDTGFGLPASGSMAWFKVYVMTTTSNEKGSNAVKIVRP